MRYLIFVLLLSTAAFSQVPPITPGVSQELAKWRAAHYSDVRYKLNLTLEKMSPVLKGSMEIRVKVGEARSGGGRESEPGAIATGSNTPIILDWRKIAGHEAKSVISNLTVNNVLAVPFTDGTTLKRTPHYGEWNEHLLIQGGVVAGENVITLDFTSPILTSGSAITRYIDKEDGSEYIYSLFVPSDASTAFPVFDQPDLKARFTLGIGHEKDWAIITNSVAKVRDYKEQHERGRTGDFPLKLGQKLTIFEESQPISTYVFAFAAGPFEKVTDAGAKGGNLSGSEGVPTSGTAQAKNTLPTGRVSASDIYVRKSQAVKFQPHAAEVFRLNREAVKYFEEYFDYKFPFPKYDLVLIPEFPFGGMEHAGATFLRESAIIFPQEPTKSDHISRAVLIFHEAAHQWFGDTVTMKWFDDLWLKEGFANFMAYKALEKIKLGGGNPTGREGVSGNLEQVDAWKVFYERIKQPAYATDSTRGTTPIYQPIENLNSAKSAYGNIDYNKAPAFLKQAEFYLGQDKFQVAVRAFLKKHEYKNATWEDLVKEFSKIEIEELTRQQHFQKLSAEEKKVAEAATMEKVEDWARVWVRYPGMLVIKPSEALLEMPFETKDLINQRIHGGGMSWPAHFLEIPVGTTIGSPEATISPENNWVQNISVIRALSDGTNEAGTANLGVEYYSLSNVTPLRRGKYKFSLTAEEWKRLQDAEERKQKARLLKRPLFIFPNYQDYGYGIFLLDDKSREYVLKNVQNEKDAFLRSMMYGALWDSVREGELDPRAYVEVAIKNLEGEQDETIAQMMTSRTATALSYYLSEPPALAGGSNAAASPASGINTQRASGEASVPPAHAGGSDMRARFESVLIERIKNAPTLGQRITFFRTLVANATTEQSRSELKAMLKGGNLSGSEGVSTSETTQAKNTLPTGRVSASIPLKTKDKFDIITRLAVLNDPDAAKLLVELEKTETTDDAKRYAYAARAAFPSKEDREKFWNDFVANKDISESWIEAAVGPFNSVRNSELSLPYLERALKELPNLKRSRKIFFVNNWLGAFIGGQRSEEALAIVNKFLSDNPNLDRDLRLKILENVDIIERAVRIRGKYK